jgi:hypothetical protein
MVVAGAGAGAAPAPSAGVAAAPVIPTQMMPMTFPATATFDYSTMLDRGATAPVIPRRSRRSERRSRQRSPMPSTGPSGSETDSRYPSPGSDDLMPQITIATIALAVSIIPSRVHPGMFSRAHPSGLSSRSSRTIQPGTVHPPEQSSSTPLKTLPQPR